MRSFIALFLISTLCGCAWSSSAPENPKIKPGNVRWLANNADARAAAVKSGKFVLHFQLLGKLDDELC